MNPLAFFMVGAVLLIIGIGMMTYTFTITGRNEKPLIVRVSISQPGDYEVKIWPSSQQTELSRVR